MNSTRGFKLAHEEALLSDFERCSTGCIAFYKGTIIAKGHNSHKTCPVQAKFNAYRGFNGYNTPAYIHAEMAVIKKIRYLDIDFSDVELYIWRGINNPMISKPCEACEHAIRSLGIKKVFYTGNNSFIAERYI